jgi:adenylate cyclase
MLGMAVHWPISVVNWSITKSLFWATATTLGLAVCATVAQQTVAYAKPFMGMSRSKEGPSPQRFFEGNRVAKRNTAAELERLLQRRLDYPEDAAAIDAEIRQTFTETHAVLILDMSGFTRETQAAGIIATLATIHQMQRIIVPIVLANAGSPVKLEADNLYAVFPTVEAAVAASQQMIQQLRMVEIRVGVGIGYGNVLMIRQDHQYRDLYGDEVNLASKLGEDLAEADTVLLTESAFEQISADRLNSAFWQPTVVTISGLQLNIYQLRLVPNQ